MDQSASPSPARHHYVTNRCRSRVYDLWPSDGRDQVAKLHLELFIHRTITRRGEYEIFMYLPVGTYVSVAGIVARTDLTLWTIHALF